jgi:hypothetical protein
VPGGPCGFLGKTAKSAVLTDVDAIERLLRDRAAMELGAFVRITTQAAPLVVPPQGGMLPDCEMISSFITGTNSKPL